MHVVKPKVFIIGETRLVDDGLDEMLAAVGAQGWGPTIEQNGVSNIHEMEVLAEVAGRLCYKSFEVGLNPNVTKVREGTYSYIENILKQKHGSVLEHASTSVALIGVSRVLTHELVRHRAGAAFSQESMRFVRLDDIGMYVPPLDNVFTELAPYASPGGSSESDKIWGQGMSERFSMAVHKVTRVAEEAMVEFTRYLDAPGVPFHIKKVITSALRRMAPGGHTTNIIATCNHRGWRHWITQRTSPGAEVEIREVFYEVAKMFEFRYPAFYQDIVYTNIPNETPQVSFLNDKV